MIRRKEPHDYHWLEQFLRERWGGSLMVSRGTMHDALVFPALIAERNGQRCGVVIYRVDCTDCEILTLDAAPPRQGTGTALIEGVAREAKEAGCKRLWLITTNDNLDALRFYQRRGFALVAVHRNAVAEARKLKPSIPAVGFYGIPLRDELELERLL